MIMDMAAQAKKNGRTVTPEPVQPAKMVSTASAAVILAGLL